MKKKTIFAVLLAMTLAAAPACLMSGCSGKTVYLADDNVTVITEAEYNQLHGQTSGAANTSNAAASTPAESTAAPAESSAAPAESSAAPAESSAAPAESSAAPAESSAAPAESSEKIVITFVKPEKWETAYAHVYEKDKDANLEETKKNGDFPGQEMTDNGDGTYSYEIPSDIPDPVVMFSDGKEGPNQWPRVSPLAVENGKVYEKG